MRGLVNGEEGGSVRRWVPVVRTEHEGSGGVRGPGGLRSEGGGEW